MKKIELVIERGLQAGRRFTVPNGGLRLGRSSSNDIHIPDAQLSRNHCLFELLDGGDVRVTDLASANGTSVNGRMLSGEPVVLRGGDVIELGSVLIRVVDPSAPASEAGSVDLGLGGGPAADSASAAPADGKRRSPIVNFLWGFAVIAAVAAIGLVLLAPAPEPEAAPTALKVEKPTVVEIAYEKVEADLEGIFRFGMFVDADGTIRVSIDDTKENRHPSIPPRQLDARAKAELNDILDSRAFCALDRDYTGAEPDPPALNSWRLKVVYSTLAHAVRVVNTQEPEEFRHIREKLEAFAKNELGIHAIQYPRAKLVELAQDAVALGRTKWEDREVQYGNLYAAIVAFKEAIFYLETVDPKPDCIKDARQGLEQATAELKKRYGDQRFLADRAINLGHWEEAQRELGVLIEMIPDRRDDRNREASAKLIDVEKRMKGEKK